MIEPSSSEEDEEEVPDAPQGHTNKPDVPNGRGPNGPHANGPQNGGLKSDPGKPGGVKDPKVEKNLTSPTLSHNSEKNLTEAELQEKHAKEEEERKRRIQLYVFVLRCVAYNFNAKQPNDMQKRHLKVTKEAHDKMKAKIEVSTLKMNVMI